MINQIDRNDCVGCKVCAIVCPVQAIEFVADKEGFEYPKVDEEKCIHCKKCLAVCPTNEKKDVPVGKLYAARNQDEEILMKSSSGGVFYALANEMISQSGIVYGVIFDENQKVVYARTEQIDGVQKMCSSKYVDAYISIDLLHQLLEDVKKNRNILFSGTSCQIAGAKKMCEIYGLNTEKVVWIDFFVCSGKVSSLLWEKEKEMLIKGNKLSKVSFRDKVRGWENFSFTVETDKSRYSKDFLVSRWSKYLGNPLCTRKSCIACGYECGACSSDISVGDFWYSQSAVPGEWRDNRGISIVKTNTQNGAMFFEKLPGIDVKEIPSVERPDKHSDKRDLKERENFWNLFYAETYQEFCRQYSHIGIKEKVLFGIVRPILIKTKLINILRK